MNHYNGCVVMMYACISSVCAPYIIRLCLCCVRVRPHVAHAINTTVLHSCSTRWLEVGRDTCTQAYFHLHVDVPERCLHFCPLISTARFLPIRRRIKKKEEEKSQFLLNSKPCCDAAAAAASAPPPLPGRMRICSSTNS